MKARMAAFAGRRIMGSGANKAPKHSTHQETNMEWQTPQACDFRFGFEITMYIAAR